MNRILFEKDEIVDGVATFGGARAEHVLTVLHGEVGQILKTGEVNGPIGTGEIVGIGQRSEVRGQTVDAFSFQSNNQTIKQSNNSAVDLDLEPRPFVKVKVNHSETSLAPWIDLILAPPRPRVMKRLLPQLAAMGVGRLFLVGAKKVEKDFWGATLLKEENYRPLLIDGLMQAGTSILPTLETRRNFRKFVTDELDALFPSSNRIVAHPYGDPSSRHSIIRLFDCSIISRPLLAIGPEGGWTDDEVALLEEHGFARYSLGARILRTDTATVALLAQLMKVYDENGQDR